MVWSLSMMDKMQHFVASDLDLHSLLDNVLQKRMTCFYDLIAKWNFPSISTGIIQYPVAQSVASPTADTGHKAS